MTHTPAINERPSRTRCSDASSSRVSGRRMTSARVIGPGRYWIRIGGRPCDDLVPSREGGSR